MSSLTQFLLFGAVSSLLVNQRSMPSSAMTLCFVLGEMGGTSVLCALLVRGLERRSLPVWTLEVVVGFVLSHLLILAVLDTEVAGAPLSLRPAPGMLPSAALEPGTMGWLKISLCVCVALVLGVTAAVLVEPRLRRAAEARGQKFLRRVGRPAT